MYILARDLSYVLMAYRCFQCQLLGDLLVVRRLEKNLRKIRILIIPLIVTLVGNSNHPFVVWFIARHC